MGKQCAWIWETPNTYLVYERHKSGDGQFSKHREKILFTASSSLVLPAGAISHSA